MQAGPVSAGPTDTEGTRARFPALRWMPSVRRMRRRPRRTPSGPENVGENTRRLTASCPGARGITRTIVQGSLSAYPQMSRADDLSAVGVNDLARDIGRVQ